MAEKNYYTSNLNDVVNAEHEFIKKRREDLKITEPELEEFVKKIPKLPNGAIDNNTNFPVSKIGLALSGGGIRSATFNLGLLQSLARYNILKYFDYLSTVSGGGYIGSCLSSLLDNPKASVEFSKFPFRFERNKEPDERQEVKWLRRYGNYLFPNKGLFSNDTWSFVALLITGLVLVNIPTFYLIIFITYFLQLIPPDTRYPLALNLLHGSLIIIALMILLRAITSLRNLGDTGRKVRTKLLGWLAICAFVFIAIGGLICLVNFVPTLDTDTSDQISAGLTTGMLAIIMGLLTGKLKVENAMQKAILKIISRLALVAFLLIIIAYILNYLWNSNAFENTIFGVPVVLIIALFLVIFSFMINPERVSMHHFYRDRLSKAYIIKRDDSRDDDAIRSNEKLTLADLHKHDNGAPYLLINCTANLPSSKNRWLRGRGGDFFLFSKLYCGSASSGYCETKHYDKGKTRLATAMAISGAATTPQSGIQSSPIKAFIYTLLNIRLNRWMPNPNPKHAPTMFYFPYYYLKELLSIGKENDGLLNLSDGGHMENLGLYQLLRRRCDVIVASDAGADPLFIFEDLANMLAKARIDLGIEISFDMKELRQDNVSKETKSVVAIGEISYPEGNKGLLIYIKSSITGKEPEDILAFRRLDPTFPHQSTTDQFFDESQFESYRALGYFTGKEVFG